MRAIVTGRGILVVGTALLAAAGMCGCAANQTPNVTGRGNGQLATSAATASGPAAAPSGGAPNTTTGPSAVQNLVISSTEKSELTAAFVAYKRISLSDILGPDPMSGSVYYACDPATEIYWAMASFATSSTASFKRAGELPGWRQHGAVPEDARGPLAGADRQPAPHMRRTAILSADRPRGMVDADIHAVV